MRRIFAVAAGLIASIAMLVLPPVFGQMATDGQFQVTANGAASYTIPIVIPPGVAGVQPTLSLDFNSQQGNDMAGVGWSLNGFSAVARCGKTMAQDGAIAPVTYTASDNFCLNGKRLVRVLPGGTSWDGVEWRTELDEFSRIISYGTAGNGPAWFEVWTKSGEVIEYGNTADSRIETSNLSDATVKVWAVGKVSDTRGNYYTVSYTEDRTNGDYYPARIDYTGNAGSSPVLAPMASVRFSYESRPDVVPIYVAGRVGKTVQRLNKIATYSGTTPVRTYALGYDISTATSRSTLTTVTECEQTNGTCRPPIELGWIGTPRHQGRYGTTMSGAVCADGSSQYGGCNDADNTSYIRYPDVNGDGRADLCYRADTGLKCYAGTAAGYFDLSAPIANTTICANGSTAYGGCNDGDNYQTIDYADVDGDGKADLVYRGDQGVQLWLSNNGVFSTHLSYAFCANGSTTYGGCNDGDNFYTIRFPDINGDGRADVCFRSDSGINCFLSTGASGWDVSRMIGSLFCANRSTNYGICNDGNNYRTIDYADFNGDGRADLTYRGDQGIQIALSTVGGFAWTYSSNICADGSTAYGGCNDDDNFNYIRHPDINGDGLPDVCFRGDTGIQCILWTGTSWDFEHRISTTICANKSSQFGICNDDDNYKTIAYVDADGDGMADLVYRGDAGLQIWFFNGTTFADNIGYPICANTSGCGMNNYKFIQIADVNGDGVPDFVARVKTGIQVFPGQGNPGDRVFALSNLLGRSTTVTYQPLTNPAVYTPDTGAAAAVYPISDVQIPMYVVSSSSSSSGIGGWITNAYHYGGLKVDHAGRGLLGFRTVDITQVNTGLSSHTEYRQDWPYIGMPSLIQKRTTSGGSGGLLNSRTMTYACLNPADGSPCSVAPGNRYFPFPVNTVESSWDLSGAALPTVTTANSSFDNFGNLLRSTVTTSDGYSKASTNTYANDTTHWFLGRLTKAVVTSSTPAGGQTRTSAFTYDGTGLLAKEVVEPGNSNFCLVTEYGRDAFGNVISSTARNCNGSALAVGTEAAAPSGDAVFAARTSTVGFGANGQFPLTRTNELNQQEASSFDPAQGTVLSQTGPNQLTTSWRYDGFGRRTLETRPDGNRTQWRYQYCSGINGGTASCPGNGAYLITVTPQNQAGDTNGAPVTEYHDALGRVIRTETIGFDGTSIIRRDSEYDALGQLSRTSRPHYVGQTIYWTTYAYDALGRLRTQTDPDPDHAGAVTTNDYNGLTTTITNALNQREVRKFNSQNQLIEKDDNAGCALTLGYEPGGNLATTTDCAGNRQVLSYDLRGRKIQMQDPDMGTWTYAYDALGELIRQQDAKHDVSTLQYDKLGRLVARVEPDLKSNWYYDAYKSGAPCPKGIGKLCEATADNGYDQTLTFDVLGRPSQATTTVDTGYTSKTTYDANGRVSVLTDPQGFAVLNKYTALGYLKEVDNNANGAMYWQANAVDAEGHVTQQTYGNTVVTQRGYDASTGRLTSIYASRPQSPGSPYVVQNLAYSYDKLGNLATRLDSNDGTSDITESFNYDDRNRLRSAAVSSSGSVLTTQYTIDNIGNLQSRSDLGTYTYPASGSLHPHAVSSISLAGSRKHLYFYDAQGNPSSDYVVDSSLNPVAGTQRHYTYTSYDQPSSITRDAGGPLSPAVNVSFQYDPNHQRVRMIDGNTTTIYLNPAGGAGLYYEKDLKPQGAEEHRHFVTAGGEVVALVKTDKLGQISSTAYLHHDALGSLVTVTNSLKVIAESLSYEPYGKRRQPNGTADTSNSLTGSTTERGFTMHEHLDDLGLINMNARIYDPAIGRFLSADSAIQDPANVQSYNRYSYVGNNPLTYTDPSGHFWNPFKHLLQFAEGLAVSTFNPLKGWSMQWQSLPGTSRIDHFIMSHPWAYSAAQIAAGVASWECLGCGSAVFSGYYTYESTGSLMAGYRAGGISIGTDLAFYGVGSIPSAGSLWDDAAINLVGHAAVGCASAATSGGNCGSGAASGFISDAATLGTKGLGVGTFQFTAATASGGAASMITGGNFFDGARTAAFGYLFNQLAHSNPAEAISQKAIRDGHLTLFEANAIWRANNDTDFNVTVDASQLTIEQTSIFGLRGTATGVVTGSDWLVYGSVTLRQINDYIYLLPDHYDFTPHDVSKYNSTWKGYMRNLETYGGFYAGSRAGTSIGTDYTIRFSGEPKIIIKY